MTIPQKTKIKIKKLVEITQALYNGETFKITRLITLKSLCETHNIAIRFVYYLSVHTENKMKDKAPSYLEQERWDKHKKLAKKAILNIDNYVHNNNEKNIKLLKISLEELIKLQDKYEKQSWGSVRLIECSETALIEKAIKCILSPTEFQFWAYHVGRDYAERYNSSFGTGLIPDSAPLMEDITRFWIQHYKLESFVISKRNY